VWGLLTLAFTFSCLVGAGWIFTALTYLICMCFFKVVRMSCRQSIEELVCVPNHCDPPGCLLALAGLLWLRHEKQPDPLLEKANRSQRTKTRSPC
jgi:hypothetical protein